MSTNNRISIAFQMSSIVQELLVIHGLLTGKTHPWDHAICRHVIATSAVRASTIASVIAHKLEGEDRDAFDAVAATTAAMADGADLDKLKKAFEAFHVAKTWFPDMPLK